MGTKTHPREAAERLAKYLHAFPSDHPLQIALRTYALALSLSLGPSLIAILTKARKRNFATLGRVLRRDLGPTGFASAITAGVAGGAALKLVWGKWEKKFHPEDGTAVSKVAGWFAKLKDWQKTFLAHALSAYVAIQLLQRRQSQGLSLSRHKNLKTLVASSTLDLTLLFFVRALDALTRGALLSTTDTSNASTTQEASAKAERRSRRFAARLDAFVFWASSARIMWCFFYQPHRLPHSYNKWIMSMANIDSRVLETLRAVHQGRWSYTRGVSSPPDMASSLAHDLGYPSSWGDVTRIPAYGGPSAVAKWKALGMSSRGPIGGIPCEIVHCGIGGNSCTSNAALRGAMAFLEALAIYLPVHFLPILLRRPRSLLDSANFLNTLLSAFRSASFLSTFVGSIWMTICLTRTVLLARIFPWISHDFWDGPSGCTLIGSLVCGSSIWVEQGKRRGEMALYVLPRAIRASLPSALVRLGPKTMLLERLVFVLSVSTLLTTFTHRPENLRGLARWTLNFVMNGPKAGFWKRHSEEPKGTSSSHENDSSNDTSHT